MSNDLRIPNLAGAPGGVPVTRDPLQAPEPRQRPEGLPQGNPAQSFTAELQARMPSAMPQPAVAGAPALGDLAKAPVKFSAHAASRLTSRGIDMGAEQMRKLGEAVDKAAAKGIDETLILTKDAAFIVSVKNRTVVTAMDRTQLDGNVFTNIEGAVIVS